jgi:hypothetical protein
MFKINYKNFNKINIQLYIYICKFFQKYVSFALKIQELKLYKKLHKIILQDFYA